MRRKDDANGAGETRRRWHQRSAVMDFKALTDELRRDEGFVAHAYEDSEGYLTIGYGRLIDEALGGGLSEAEARLLLENDILDALNDLDRSVPWWRDLPDPAGRALANMAFNLGWPRLAGFVKMLAALEAGNLETAAAEALNSKWARQVGDRSRRIATLYRTAD